jgi:signal transduction histidine kinase
MNRQAPFKSIEHIFVERISWLSILLFSFTFVSEIITSDFVHRQHLVIDALTFLVLAISLVACYKSGHVTAAVITISGLLLLIAYEIHFANYIRPTSLGILVILGVFISLIFTGALQIFLHSVVVLLLITVFFHYPPEVTFSHGIVELGKSMDPEDFYAFIFNFILIYVVISYVTFKLKQSHDSLLNTVNKSRIEIIKANSKLQGLLQAKEEVVNKHINANSHSIRGPVARILGILQLHSVPNDEVLTLIKNEALELDNVIKEVNNDLSKMTNGSN